MLQEEIARLTGRLKFEVDNRPLMAFEKRLGGVMSMLRDLSVLANKKFTVKVALDSKSLRTQIERATKTKISLTNVDISQEALNLQAKRVQEYLNKTPINLANVKVDIGKLVEQKRFVKTLMGQMSLDLPLKLNTSRFEAELRADLKLISDRNAVKIKVDLNNNNLAVKLRRAMIEAQKRMGEMKIRVADPQVRLKVDRQHLIEEIKAALASAEFRVRLNARNQDFLSERRERASRASGGRAASDRGLSAVGHFARGALPGLGAAFAFSQMNDINQKVVAATNSLEAVSGSQENFNSNNNYLHNISREMGLNFRDIAPQFSSILQAAGSSIGTGGTQDMFRGIMQFGTTHGLSSEAMKGSMVALSQMFGKDKIQSEEARQQFAERMPNGMAMLAQAAGNVKLTKNGTVAEFGELMQKGNADPKKILPELGRLMKEASERNDAYAKSLDTTRTAQNRMNVAFEEAVTVFAQGGFDRGMGEFFKSMTDGMNRSQPLIKALGAAFENLVKPVSALIRIVSVLGENWDRIAKSFGLSGDALATLSAAVGIALFPFTRFLGIVGLIALAVDDLLTYMQGGGSIFGDWVSSTEGAQGAVDKLTESWNTFKTSLSNTTQAVTDLLEKMGLLSNATKGVNFDSAFISGLDKLATILNALSSAMDAITKLTNGDFKGLGQSLVDMKNQLESYATKNITDFAEGTIRGAAAAMIAARPAEQMPNQASGTIDRVSKTTDEALARQAMTFEITIPIEVSGMLNAGDLTTTIQEPLKAAVDDMFRQALGAARAQQAERQ